MSEMRAEQMPPLRVGRLTAAGSAWCVLLGLVLTGCAGYQIGNQTLYPRHIRTVHVPMVESASFRRNMGERLTEAICREIESKTDYKVTGDPTADSILQCHILGDKKRQTVVGRTGDPREIQVSLRIEVRWVDRTGKAMHPARSVPLPSDFTNVDASANLVPEAGQSVATAHQQAIQRAAEQIVGLMEAPW